MRVLELLDSEVVFTVVTLTLLALCLLCAWVERVVWGGEDAS